MSWTDFHVHSFYCHGLGQPEEYITAGIKKGVRRIGFASHAPLPGKDWTIKEEELQNYFADIRSLQNKYAGQIDIFLGLEVDYIPGTQRFESFRTCGLDYLIGSNHFIGKNKEGEYRRIESMYALEVMEKGVKSTLEDYFNAINNMIKLEKPDILAHLDLIKKVNRHSNFFSGDEGWYKELVDATLDTLAKTNVIVELNTSGIDKGWLDWSFPGEIIIEGCFLRGIPVTLSSDAHAPKEVAQGFKKALQLLGSIGFRELAVLTNSGWRCEDIESFG